MARSSIRTSRPVCPLRRPYLPQRSRQKSPSGRERLQQRGPSSGSRRHRSVHLPALDLRARDLRGLLRGLERDAGAAHPTDECDQRNLLGNRSGRAARGGRIAGERGRLDLEDLRVPCADPGERQHLRWLPRHPAHAGHVQDQDACREGKGVMRLDARWIAHWRLAVSLVRSAALAALFSLSLLAPVAAREVTDAEKAALAETISSFDAAMRANDMERIMGTIPPRMLDAMAAQFGVTIE